MLTNVDFGSYIVVAAAKSADGIGVPNIQADHNRCRIAVFLCLQHSFACVSGGLCGGAFGHAGPGPVRQLRMVHPPSFLIGVGKWGCLKALFQEIAMHIQDPTQVASAEDVRILETIITKIDDCSMDGFVRIQAIASVLSDFVEQRECGSPDLFQIRTLLKIILSIAEERQDSLNCYVEDAHCQRLKNTHNKNHTAVTTGGQIHE